MPLIWHNIQLTPFDSRRGGWWVDFLLRGNPLALNTVKGESGRKLSKFAFKIKAFPRDACCSIIVFVSKETNKLHLHMSQNANWNCIRNMKCGILTLCFWLWASVPVCIYARCRLKTYIKIADLLQRNAYVYMYICFDCILYVHLHISTLFILLLEINRCLKIKIHIAYIKKQNENNKSYKVDRDIVFALTLNQNSLFFIFVSLSLSFWSKWLIWKPKCCFKQELLQWSVSPRSPIRIFILKDLRWKSFWYNLTLLTVARAPGFQIRNPAVAARGHTDRRTLQSRELVGQEGGTDGGSRHARWTLFDLPLR